MSPDNIKAESRGVARGKPTSEGRFVWISSLAAERIVNELGATEAAFGMAVYMALARLSGKDKNNPIIEATVQKIAGLARLSYPKTLAILDALETQAKVISIERRERISGQTKQLPHIYTLLSCRLNSVKPASVNTVKPARLNGAGSTEQASQYSENPIDSLKGESKKEDRDPSATAGHAGLDGQQSIDWRTLP